jgi:hypothetical protein
MNSSPVIYTLCPDASPEQARDVRARAWTFIFDCCAKKKGGAGHTANDPKEIKYDQATAIEPE